MIESLETLNGRPLSSRVDRSKSLVGFAGSKVGCVYLILVRIGVIHYPAVID